jgi:replicative superfamily II helicase
MAIASPPTGHINNMEIEEKLNLLIAALSMTPGWNADLQRRLIPILKKGCAVHHADLTPEARAMIEQGFREGVFLVLYCTSTLSTGVNLPADVVVVRHSQYLTGIKSKSSAL